MAKANRTAGQAVVDALLAEKVDLVFGLVGSHIFPISDALLAAEGIRFVTVKHENNASSMADVYGRLTHRPGVCLVTAGPGATNSLTGVAQAYAAASPMVHISGTVPRHAERGAFHGVDRPEFLYQMFRDVTKWSIRVDETEDIPRILATAFSVARSGRPGPVHVELPLDLLEEGPTEVWPYEGAPSEGRSPDPRLVDRVTELLLGAQNPVICVGKGVLALSTTAELVALAESIAAPVVFPADAIGVFPAAHPLCAGAFSAFLPNPFPLQLIEESDVLLSVGMRAGTSDAQVVEAHTPDNYMCLHLEEESQDAGGASIRAVVDCKAILGEMVARMGGGEKRPGGEIKRRIAEAKSAIRKGLNQAMDEYRGHKPIHFGLAVRDLAPLLDQDAVIVGDVGNHMVWTSNFLAIQGPQKVIMPGSWGAMGFSLPGAIAAKMVHPERQVIGITGDGSFLMSCSDFGTALEVEANVVMVILNDSRYGMIHTLQMRDFGRTYGSELRSPDFARFAESFGALGIRVEDDSELTGAFERALAAKGPVIVDVVCGYDFPLLWPGQFLAEEG